MLVLMIIGYMLLYIDRATLSVANPLVRDEMKISISEMGVLLSAFLWTNCLLQIPMGGLIDKFQPRLVFYVSMIFWSLAQILGGLVGSFNQFIGARILLGVGEAPYTVNAALATRHWFNVWERGSATGAWSAGSSLGNALSIPLLTYLMLTFSWRWMFMIIGIFGLALGAVFFALYKNPAQISLTADERAHLKEGEKPSELTTSSSVWKDCQILFRFKTTWGLAIGWFGPVYVAWFYFAWLPNYLETDRHISIAKTGWVGAIPFIAGVVGALLGGRITDILVRRGFTPLNSRRYPIVLAMLLTGFLTVIIAETPSTAVAVTCISLSFLMIYIASAATLATPAIIAPMHVTGSIGGIQAFGGYIGSALAPMVTGFIVDASGSFKLALLLGAAVAFISPLLYFVLVREPISQAQLDAAQSS
jgi:sugar phosphate permease